MDTKAYVQHLRKQMLKPQFDNIVVQEPPADEKPDSFSWSVSLIQCIVPVISFLVISWVTEDINVALLGAIITGVGALITSLITHFQKKHKINENNKEKEDTYRKYLTDIEEEVKQRRTAVERFNEACYPLPSESISIIRDKSERLWDRQLFYNDFLHVYIGKKETIGVTVTFPRYEKDSKYFTEYDRIKTLSKFEQPKLIDLKNFPIAVFGSERHLASMIKNLFVDICCHHSYTDVQMIFLGMPNPYDSPKNSKYCYVDEMNLIGRSSSECGKIKEWVFELLEKRKNSILKEEPHKPIFPIYLLFADVSMLTESEKARLLQYSQQNLGFTTVFLTSRIEFLPKGVNCILACSETSVEIHDGKSDPISYEAQYICEKWDNLMTMIDQIHSVTDIVFAELPTLISLYDGFGVKSAKELNILSRWQKNKNGKSLSTPIGIKSDGKIQELDISDFADGPHGLVAGMTGSGKSEFLNTFILSLAINYPPSRVRFYLVDYKGGFLAYKFHNLPHVSGIATNLDDNLHQMLNELNEILNERMRSFSKASCSHIDQYNSKNDKPLPHIALIIDEFAEIKRESPDIMERIMRIARTGRALGVHLLLATQAPTGVVNDQIHANMRYRVCFRLPETSDSLDVIKSPDAAFIKHTGRACVAVFGEEVEQVQIFFSEAYDRNNTISRRQSDCVIQYIKAAHHE